MWPSCMEIIKSRLFFFHKIQFYNILYNYIKYITEFKFERIEEFFLFNIAHSSYISLKFLHGFLH